MATKTTKRSAEATKRTGAKPAAKSAAATSREIHLGRGIFMWSVGERRSDRYGAFYLTDQTYDGTTHPCKVDEDAIRSLRGQRARIVCIVRAARTSGHIGDIFRGVFPTTPNVGERIELGEGTIVIERAPGIPETIIAVRPRDSRQTDWLPIKKLYRLHDQTVDVYAEVIGTRKARS